MFFIYFNIIDTDLKSQSAEHEGDKIGMSEMEDTVTNKNQVSRLRNET